MSLNKEFYRVSTVKEWNYLAYAYVATNDRYVFSRMTFRANTKL